MTQRERSMLLVLGVVGGFLLLFGAFVVVTKAMDNLDQKDRQITRLETDNSHTDIRLIQLVQSQRKLDDWRTLSLPQDTSTASTRYRTFLLELARQHRLTVSSRPASEGAGLGNVGPANAPFVRLRFPFQVEGTLPQFISFLHDYYSINLPHQIRGLTITPLGAAADARLRFDLTIEAVSVTGPKSRDFLLPSPDPRLVAIDVFSAFKHGPTGLGMAAWTLLPTGPHGGRKLAAKVQPERDYTTMVMKNVFAGLSPPVAPPAKPPPDAAMLRFVHLTDINTNLVGREAFLYCRPTNKEIRLRSEVPYDSFDIQDSTNQSVLKGKVKHVGRRDVVIEVNGKLHVVHVGQSLEDALKREASEEELKDFNIKTDAPPENS